MSLEDLKKQIRETGNVPGHVAIIMDGNGRWAKKRGLKRTEGHKAGVKAVQRVVRLAHPLGVKYLTLYTFSIENWNRPKSEVAYIMKLLYNTTRSELDELHENEVKLIATGRISGIPQTSRMMLRKAIRKTANNNGLVLNLALNYGGRTEIIDAVKKLVKDVKKGNVSERKISPELFENYLYTSELPDPDLLIRTSGEMRLSNFLLWQTYYTELYITDVLWPDYKEEDFCKAIIDYQNRERRFGRLANKSR
ncbi:MAG: isoprenyl transferase [candidate division Zixibacteria bacterium]|nr:isoprenyl transferase [candidate division Zixibacteria bacterium]